MKVQKVFLACLAITIFFQSIFAQQTETVQLTGRILDMMGSAIPGIGVVAYSPTKIKYESTTDENGVYSLNLQKGIYKLEVNNQVARYNGFESVKLNNYQVVPAYDGKLNFDIALPVAGNGIICSFDISDYSENLSSSKKEKKNSRRRKN